MISERELEDLVERIAVIPLACCTCGISGLDMRLVAAGRHAFCEAHHATGRLCNAGCEEPLREDEVRAARELMGIERRP